MSKIEKFEDIHAWQKARELIKEIYRVCRVESLRKDYSLADQIKRSSVSVMANIAEGFARRTSKEFMNFLSIAHASVAELQSHLYVALDQNYITDNEFHDLYGKAEEISKMVMSLSNYLRTLKTQ